MINGLLKLLLNIILKIVSIILNVILSPLTLLINGLFPNVNSYISSFLTLFNNHLLNGLRFAREVALNITGINRNLIGIAFAIPLTYFTFMLANNGIRFITSIYRMYKTGKDN